MQESKDFQREGMLAEIITERDIIILNQSQQIQNLQAENKTLTEKVGELLKKDSASEISN